MRRYILVAGLIIATPAAAQQQPDPEFVQRAIAIIQQQRNTCLDTSAANDAKLQLELAKAQARIKELEAAKGGK